MKSVPDETVICTTQANRDVDHLPGGWRDDKHNLKTMGARQKALHKDKEEVADKVVCPWRPGGQHIAKVCQL